jgi:glycogen operon protein
MTHAEWNNGNLLSIGLIKSGDNLENIRRKRKPGYENTLMILLNADPAETEFTIPSFGVAEKWQIMIDTSTAGSPKGLRSVSSGAACVTAGRSLMVLKPIYTSKAGDEVPSVK